MKQATNNGPLRAKLASWLATGGSIAQFARNNPGRHLRTYQNWVAEPGFADEVHKQVSLMLEGTRRRLTSLALKSTETLNRLLDDANATVRLGAARVVLDKLLDVNDSADFDRRLAELEQRAEHETQR